MKATIGNAIEGLEILAKYHKKGKKAVIHAAHSDVLWCVPAEVSKTDESKLWDIGWFLDEDGCWSLKVG